MFARFLSCYAVSARDYVDSRYLCDLSPLQEPGGPRCRRRRRRDGHREPRMARRPDVTAPIQVVVLGLPIGDTLLSIVRRAVRGAPIFHSDRGHIHHRLLAAGLSQRQVVLVLYGICLILGATAVGLTRANAGQT